VDRKPDPAPYEGDVARIVLIGTVLWLASGVALLPFWGPLDDHGFLWLIGTCFCGAFFGVLGHAKVRARDRRAGRG